MQYTFRFLFFVFFFGDTGDCLAAGLKGDRRGGKRPGEELGPQRRRLLVVFLSVFVEQEPSAPALLVSYRLSPRSLVAVCELFHFWHGESSSPTRDQTWVTCIGNA